MGGQHCPLSMQQILMANRLEVFKVAQKNAWKFWHPARDPKRSQHRFKCCMALSPDRFRVAGKKFGSQFVKCTV